MHRWAIVLTMLLLTNDFFSPVISTSFEVLSIALCDLSNLLHKLQLQANLWRSTTHSEPWQRFFRSNLSWVSDPVSLKLDFSSPSSPAFPPSSPASSLPGVASRSPFRPPWASANLTPPPLLFLISGLGDFFSTLLLLPF